VGSDDAADRHALDQPEHRPDRRHLGRDHRLGTGRLEALLEQRARREARRQEHEPLLVQLDHADALPRGHRMVVRDDEHHLLVVERLEPEIGLRARPIGDADVELAGVQRRDDLVGGELVDPHLHGRMAAEEDRDAVRDQADVEGVRRTDAHPPREPATARAQRRDALVDLAQCARRVGEEQLARLGRHHLAADALEERLADLLLELADLVRERRLGDVDVRRGAREAQAVGQGHEVAQVSQLHGNPVIESMPSIISMAKDHLSSPPCAVYRRRRMKQAARPAATETPWITSGNA